MTTSPQNGPDDTTAALPGGPNSEGQKSRPRRVPNVSPNAKSGLDHEVIGSNAVEAYDATAPEAPQEPQAAADSAGDPAAAPEPTDDPGTAQDAPDGSEGEATASVGVPGNPDLSGNGEGVPSDGDGVPAT